MNEGRLRSRCKPCEAEIRRLERRAKNPEWFEGRDLTAQGERKCRVCGSLKPLSEFPEDKGKHGGRRWQCTACSKTARSEWYQRNAEERKAKQRKYRNEHREECNAARREYYKANRERLIDGGRRYREENADHCREYEKKRHLDPKRREYSKRLLRLTTLKRRAAYHEPYSTRDLLALLRIQRGRCAACGKKIQNTYTVDHVMPLSKGGADAIWNIQLLCMKCNSSKGAKHPDQWAQKLGRLFI